jgi:hypothetical protein
MHPDTAPSGALPRLRLFKPRILKAAALARIAPPDSGMTASSRVPLERALQELLQWPYVRVVSGTAASGWPTNWLASTERPSSPRRSPVPPPRKRSTGRRYRLADVDPWTGHAAPAT